MPPLHRPSPCLLCAFSSPQITRGSHRFAPVVLPKRNRSHSAQLYRRPLGGRDQGLDQGRPPKDALGKANGRGTYRPAFLDTSPVAKKAHSNAIRKFYSDKLEQLEASLTEGTTLENLDLTRESFASLWSDFKKKVFDEARSLSAFPSRQQSRERRSIYARLRHQFYEHVFQKRFTQEDLNNQRQLASMKYPEEWYPGARALVRTVHLHVGPTNSGKTYHALKRLEEAQSGVYLGPLRLLAHEVYSRLNAQGKPCALITGEEMRVPEGDFSWKSCTVEMAPLSAKIEVAVIDEIQMICHSERGWAWTSAFLGLQAKEIHVCGEERAVPIIRELCAMTGDKVEIHRYKRLTPLRVADRSLKGDFGRLEKGDCVVSFSVLGIHALRKEIESKTGRKVAIIYGSLPPETRAQQAKLFNDPDNDYDFLVASDAIGMGLNLNIKRVIFESMTKSDGLQLHPLSVSEVKQIAGRAGRYKTAFQAIAEAETEKAESVTADDSNPSDAKAEFRTAVTQSPPKTDTVGYVTTLEPFDFPELGRKMAQDPPIITAAGLHAPAVVVERFARYFPPSTPFSYILRRLNEISATHSRFFYCDLRDNLALSDAIHEVENLTVADRLVFTAAPANVDVPAIKRLMITLARCVADGKSGALLDLPGLPLEILDEPPSARREYLRPLEDLHKMLVLYLWLSYRFPNVFTTRPLAEYTKQMVENAIDHCLEEFAFTPAAIQAAKRKKLMAATAQKLRRGLEEVEHVDDVNEFPTDAIDFPSPTVHDHHHHHRQAHGPQSIQYDKRFAPYGSLEEVAALANGQIARTEMLAQKVEDVKRGVAPYCIDLNVEPTDSDRLQPLVTYFFPSRRS